MHMTACSIIKIDNMVVNTWPACPQNVVIKNNIGKNKYYNNILWLYIILQN